MTTPRTRRRRTAPPGTVVAYLRCSTDEQAVSGLGLEAQRQTIADYAARKGLTIVDEFIDPGISGKTLKDRPGALAALEAVRTRQAAGLLTAKMDRLSRSVPDGARLMEEARDDGWALHFADLDIDTSTPAGEMAANVIISASQYERRLISQRTRDALAAKRARGVRLGRPSKTPEAVTRRVVDARARGMTLQAIADGLTADGVPTVRGAAVWRTSTVQAVLASQDAAKIATRDRVTA